MPDPITRLLIADDHQIVRAGLRHILESHPNWEVVAEASDGKEAVRKAIESKPDIAIIDYSLPIMTYPADSGAFGKDRGSHLYGA